MRIHPAPSTQLKNLIEISGKDVFIPNSGEVAKQPCVFALWARSPESIAESKKALLNLLLGTPSRIRDVGSPQLDFAELKAVGLQHGWATACDDRPGYVDMLQVAPYGIHDNRFKELSLREKAAFLMIFLGQMENFDGSAHRKCVVLLDTYKAAVNKERTMKKAANKALRKSGNTPIAYLAESMPYDYDEQYQYLDSSHGTCPEETSTEVAYLSHRLEQVETQLKQAEKASAAGAAEASLNAEKEREVQIAVNACRDMLKFISPDEPQDHHEDVLAGYEK